MEMRKRRKNARDQGNKLRPDISLSRNDSQHQRKQRTWCIALEETLYELLSRTTFALADGTGADIDKIKASECLLSRTTLADVNKIEASECHSVPVL